MKANELMQGDIILYEYDGEKYPARVKKSIAIAFLLKVVVQIRKK